MQHIVQEFKKNPGAVWIMKPIGLCGGRGIFLFTKLQHIADWKRDNRFASGGDQSNVDTYIVQRWVHCVMCPRGPPTDVGK